MLEIDIINKADINLEGYPLNLLSNIFIQEQNIINKNKSYIVGLLLCDNHEISLLNSKFRNKNYPTNCLSFPSYSVNELSNLKENNIYLGDIAISIEKLKSEILSQNKDLNAHFMHILVHSILHLLGYDHINDIDAAKMEKLEVLILRKLGYNDPYK